MTKFSRSERLAAALAVEAGDSLRSVSRQFGMSTEVVSRSVRLYGKHGETGFRAQKASYTVAQKLVVLQTMHWRGLSCVEAGVEFGIRGSATVWTWERQYLENGIDGLKPKKKGRRPKVTKPKAAPTPYEQLLAENEYLRAENEYLKKLNALVQEREAREKQGGSSE
jgi:transposase